METDIAIVGAGFAGTCAAHVLSRGVSRVALIERQVECADVFRAEKIEPDQAALMRDLCLLDKRSPLAGPIGVISNFEGGRLVPFDTTEQYGISYADTVNTLRRTLPANVEQIVGRVESIQPDSRAPRVSLEDGRRIGARLVVLATGGNDRLLSSLAVSRWRDRRLRSLSFGYDLALPERSMQNLRGFNYFLPPNEQGIDYLTTFRIGSRVRVNLFTQLAPTDPFVRCFRESPLEYMRRLFPELEDHIGSMKIVSTVQVVPTSFHRLVSPARAGVVFIGEEYQSVSPTTGTGLSRILTDVKVLCMRHAPEWLRRKKIDPRSTSNFYRDREKVLSDRRSLRAWMYYQNRQIDRTSLPSRMRQKLLLRGIPA